MRNTVGKLFKEFHYPISDQDREILRQFIIEPRTFLDNDAELALDLKLLQEKRKLQILERQLVGEVHLEKLDKKDLERCGVTRREFDIIKKLLKLDPEIFAVRLGPESSPYTYTVDLSKYQDTKIPQDCKEILFRPQKMRKLYERYWQLASDFETEKKDKAVADKKLKWNDSNNDKVAKTEEEYKMIDQIFETLNRLADEDMAKVKTLKQEADDFKQEADEKFKDTKKYPSPSHYQDGFDYHANKIIDQVNEKGFCTKSQLEYLQLWRERTQWQQKHTYEDFKIAEAKFFDDQRISKAKARGEDYLVPLYDDQFVDETLHDKLGHLYPNNMKRKDVNKLLHDIKKISKGQKEQTKELSTSTLPPELKEKFDALDKLETLGKEDRQAVLSWFVDEMRQHLLNHLHSSELLKEMPVREQQELLQQLSELQQKCRDQLHEAHQE